MEERLCDQCGKWWHTLTGGHRCLSDDVAQVQFLQRRARRIAALHRVSRPCDDPEDHLDFDPDDLPLSDNAASP